MANDLSSSIRDVLIDFLAPLRDAARNQNALADWLATLGHTQAISGDSSLLEIARRAQLVIDQLSALDSGTLKSWKGLASVLQSGKEISDIQRELREFAEDPGRAQVAGELAKEIMSLLLASHLRRRHPVAFRVASLLTLIEARETATLDPPIIENGATIRYSRVLDRFKVESVSSLISHPRETLKDVYFPNEMASGADAWLSAARLFPNLSFLADALGLSWRTEYRSTAEAAPEPTEPDPEQTPLSHFDAVADEQESTEPPPPAPIPDEYYATYHPTFRLKLAGDESADGNGEVAIEIAPSSQAHESPIPGLVISATGDFNRTETRGPWKMTLSASGAIPALVVGPDGVSRVSDEGPSTSGTAKLLVERMPEEGSSGPAFLLGSAEGTRLEIGSLRFATDLSYDAARTDVSAGLDAASGALILAAKETDGFLSRILPDEGIRADFDLGLVWSSKTGLTLRGAAGLEATLPIGLSIFGLSVPAVHLSLQARDEGLFAEVSANVAASLGPVRASIDRVGVAAAMTFPEDGGNLGVANLDIGFKYPNGVGLSIDKAGVSGGGYLYFDKEKGQYAGVVQLNLHGDISVKGIGLIATRLPDNSKGFSLLVIITAEDFKPIPLPLGFKLTGIGGLLALNRTFDEEVLRAGLKNNALDSVMFPKDPIRNAPQIIGNLNKVFPVAEGHHLFGPVAQITWGAKGLLTANLALVLELGERLRLLILAQIAVILPRPENDLIRLKMDAVGVIDFDQGRASLDATLHDSRLLKKYTLTGDMAMRLKWRDGPNFALAVGGLHPAFNPPPNFPRLERVAINLSSGDKLRIRCEAYFALTSNTVQFGSRTELYAEALGFSVQGEIGYDVLIQFDPFQFLADFHAQVQLKRGSRNLFKVRLEGELSGPRPLRIKAKATFEVLWMDVSFRVDKTLVSGVRPEAPAPVAVMPLLREALGNPSNWVAKLPAGGRQMVTLRAVPVAANDVLLHPLGTLTVKQNVVPLNMEITRFGPARPDGERRFTITNVSMGGQNQTALRAVKDFFAPAQYFEMSDGEKLSRPSFEMMTAGVVIGSDEIAITTESADWLEVDAVKFETVVVDKQRNESRRSASGLYELSRESLGKQARFGAAGASEVRRSGNAKYRAGAPKYRIVKEGWSIVATDDVPEQPGSVVESYSEAAQVLRELKQEKPAAAAGLKILRPSELPEG